MIRATLNLPSSLYAETATLGKAVSNAGRLKLLDLLCQCEKTVETLARQSGLGIKLTSAHLKELRRARLVESRRRGRYVLYRVPGADVARFWVTLRTLAERRIPEIRHALDDPRDGSGKLEPLDRKALLAKAKRGEIIILDVRPREEFEAGHLHGARSIPLEELGKNLRHLPRNKKIVAYCRGPFCVLAGQALRLLRKAGFKASRITDGVADWLAAGLPIAKGGNHENAVYPE